MWRSRFQQSIGGLVLLLILAACMPSSTQPNTPSAEEVEAQVSTSVALTISAEKTRISAFTPTATDTATPTAIFTETWMSTFPTLTPFPSSTPHALGNGSSFTPSPYECTVVNKKPADNTVFKPNNEFDVKFSLWNTGTKNWDAGPDLLFNSGTNMLKTNISYELPAVRSGEIVGPFIFDAKAPNKAGTFTMTFKVQGGFCYPYIRIIVKKK